MAYFSNGTEGMAYEDRHCAECVHGQDQEKGCPVMDAHYLYAYELCNSKEAGKVILDMLIPMDEHHYPKKCSLFYPHSPFQKP